MKFIDLFAGIGGFRMGLEKSGHECVGWCENDKFAQKSYRAIYNTKGEWFHDDIRTVNPGELPDAEMFCGGFPCQSFSVAGNRGGTEDERGNLFFEIIRLAQAREPKYLFLENVPGLLRSDQGKDFLIFLDTLDELGYEFEWQVLNSRHFGVPQHRERVYIIGHFGGITRFPIFPFREYDRVSGTSRRQPLPTLTATDHKGPSKQRNSLVIYEEGRGLRKLTPRESWRLQGFPDEVFEKAQEVNSNTQLYKQAGNSVTVNVIEAIGQRL